MPAPSPFSLQEQTFAGLTGTVCDRCRLIHHQTIRGVTCEVTAHMEQPREKLLRQVTVGPSDGVMVRWCPDLHSKSYFAG